ncbi:MAG: hypothetical protein WCG27_10010, partial [Pseudomonadota bacterium]
NIFLQNNEKLKKSSKVGIDEMNQLLIDWKKYLSGERLFAQSNLLQDHLALVNIFSNIEKRLVTLSQESEFHALLSITQYHQVLRLVKKELATDLKPLKDLNTTSMGVLGTMIETLSNESLKPNWISNVEDQLRMLQTSSTLGEKLLAHLALKNIFISLSRSSDKHNLEEKLFIWNRSASWKRIYTELVPALVESLREAEDMRKLIINDTNLIKIPTPNGAQAKYVVNVEGLSLLPGVYQCPPSHTCQLYTESSIDWGPFVIFQGRLLRSEDGKRGSVSNIQIIASSVEEIILDLSVPENQLPIKADNGLDYMPPKYAWVEKVVEYCANRKTIDAGLFTISWCVEWKTRKELERVMVEPERAPTDGKNGEQGFKAGDFFLTQKDNATSLTQSNILVLAIGGQGGEGGDAGKHAGNFEPTDNGLGGERGIGGLYTPSHQQRGGQLIPFHSFSGPEGKDGKRHGPKKVPPKSDDKKTNNGQPGK